MDGLEATSATDGREGLLRWVDLRTAAGWIGRLWKNGSEVCGKLDRELLRDGLRCLMVDLFWLRVREPLSDVNFVYYESDLR